MSPWGHLKRRIAANPWILVAPITIVIGVLFVPFESYRWIAHSIVGLTAFSFLVVTAAIGTVLAGRIRRPPSPARFRLHRKLGITMGFLAASTLAYGLWMVSARGYPLLVSLHGFVGIAVLTLSTAQIFVGFALKRHKPTGFVHRWNGYFLTGLVLLQITLGVFLPPPLAGGTPRYSMRLSTPPVEETWLPDGAIGPQEYFFTRVLDDGNYAVSYRTDGEYIYTGLKVTTPGWVGIGISAGEGMLNADIVFGFVDRDGKAVVKDHFGTSKTGHSPDPELGGVDNIVEFGGKMDGEHTIIEFKRPLSAGDKYDISLVEGVQTLLWAYGASDSPLLHTARGQFDVVLRPR